MGCGGRGPEKITVAGTTFPNTVGEEHWLDFERNVERLSDGGMPLRMLIYGQLGSEEQLVSGIRRGRIHFANLSAMVISTFIPETALLYAPYLFTSEAEADYVYDKYLTDFFRGLLAEKDLYLLTWYEIGFLNVYAKIPLLTPNDAEGRRFRVGASEAARLFAEAIGADVIPMGFAEVVSSLQTGLIEAGENSVSLYARTGIAGEAPHLTLTEHSFGVSLIVTRKSWWDGLSAEERGVLTEAYPAIADSRAATRAETSADLLDGKVLGIIVHELSGAQRLAWERATRDVTAQLVENIGGRAGEVYALVQQGRREFAARE